MSEEEKKRQIRKGVFRVKTLEEMDEQGREPERVEKKAHPIVLSPETLPSIHGDDLPPEVVRFLVDYSEERETCSGAAYEIHRLGVVNGHDFTGTVCSDVLVWCWQRGVPTGGRGFSDGQKSVFETKFDPDRDQ